jgi:hypothetical protein
MLFKEVIAVYNENHVEFMNTKYNVTNWETGWYIYLPLGFKGFKGSVDTQEHRALLTLSHEEADESHAGSCVVINPASLSSDGMGPSSPGLP